MLDLRRLFSSDLVPHLDDSHAKHAAVMVAIYGNEPTVIMTEKPKSMLQHGGEISFPGGKLSEQDCDLLDTAIRETMEELSLDIPKESVVGQLGHVQTRNSGFAIIPFVAILDCVEQLQPNSEVEEVLHIPLIPLLRTLRIDDDAEHRALFEAYSLTYGDKIIWGASARILKQIADIFRQNNLI